MLREDYECKLTTLNLPFEIGVPNKNKLIRLAEIDINGLSTTQIFPYRKIIRFNSTYLETIDSWESIRGRATGLALPMWDVCLFALSSMVYMMIDSFIDKVYWFSILVCGLGFGFTYIIYSNYNICRYDLFGYTHYPLRFNRKTQKVYAFSPQQNKIIELNWRELRFSTVQEKHEIELRASKVNQDNLVEQEIIFPYRIPKYQPELAEQHLAFFKAYMDGEDLQRIDASITEFFDIYNRKETLKESFERLYMSYNVYEETSAIRPEEKGTFSSALNILLLLLQLLVKRLSFVFSKLPQWPAHIEQECQIEANDPYDSTGKPRHLAPLKFTVLQILIFTVTGLLMASFFILLFTWITLASLNSA